MTHRRVYRWRFAATATLALLGLALLYASPLVLALSVVPLTFVAYGSLSGIPTASSVRVERSFDDRTPHPGERATVTLTVTNTGSGTLPDLRVIDGVPDALAVVEGTPRASVSLRPGDEATLTYTVVAKRGEFEFDDPVVRIRSLSGAERATEVVPAVGETTLSVRNPLSEPPVRNTTLLRAGTHPTDSGGEGLEFRATREYQHGDPRSRIHWRRFAKTGELTTVTYREERAVRTVVIVDARENGRVTPQAGSPTGTELCGYAGQRLYEALLDADVVTSVGAVGLDDSHAGTVPELADGVHWVDGEADNAHRLSEMLLEAVQTDPGTVEDGGLNSGRDRDGQDRDGHDPDDHDPDDGPRTRDASTDATESTATTRTDGGGDRSGGVDWRTNALLAQFPPTAQVVFVTPALDNWPVSVARTFHERGYPLTVVSPDVTGDATVGQRIVGLERERRLRRMDAASATTISWDRSDPIDAALSTSLQHLLST